MDFAPNKRRGIIVNVNIDVGPHAPFFFCLVSIASGPTVSVNGAGVVVGGDIVVGVGVVVGAVVVGVGVVVGGAVVVGSGVGVGGSVVGSGPVIVPVSP